MLILMLLCVVGLSIMMIEKTEKLFTTFCTRLVSLFLYLMKATDDGSMAASETRINIEYL